MRAARRGGAFFAAFFLIILVFLTIFLRLAGLVTVVFLRFALALVFIAMAVWKVFIRSLPNKKVSQQARRLSSIIDHRHINTIAPGEVETEDIHSAGIIPSTLLQQNLPRADIDGGACLTRSLARSRLRVSSEGRQSGGDLCDALLQLALHSCFPQC